jgi:hypothetical protein
MTATDRRRPITATDFNRLLFALLLLAALAVLARLITRQESRAEEPDNRIALAQWVQTADALFLRGEWSMAAEAYFGALESASRERMAVESALHKKLAICLANIGDHRSATHFLRLYRQRLLEFQADPSGAYGGFANQSQDPESLARELAETETLLNTWEAAGA